MLSLLFYFAVGPQEDAAARFEKFMRSANSLKVDMGLKVSSVAEQGKGLFQMKRPEHLLFAMKWRMSDYSFSIAGEQCVAIERGSKVFREYGAIGRYFLPEPDISATSEYAFPLPLLTGSLRFVVPTGVKFVAAGKTTFDGAPADLVRAQYTVPGTNVTVEGKIDKQGKLLEFTTKYGGDEPQIRSLSFRNYRVNPTLSDSSFVTEIPVGYTARTLPPDSHPIEFGESWPMDNWMPVSGSGNLKALAQNRVLFIAIGDPDCEASMRSVRAIDALAKRIEDKGGVSVAICPSQSSPKPVYKSVPNFYDPTGRLFSRLRIPGTPIFYLVSPKGTVTRLWYGFDSAQSAEFAKDVLEWVDPNKGLP